MGKEGVTQVVGYHVIPGFMEGSFMDVCMCVRACMCVLSDV